MSKVIPFPSKNSEYAQAKIDEIRDAIKLEGIVEDYFEEGPISSIREPYLWRNKYQGIHIEINPFAFETESDYLACCDALAEVMFEFDQL